MTLVTVRDITIVVVALLYAFTHWGPGGPETKRAVSLVTTSLLIGVVIVWGFWVLVGHRIT